MPVINSRLRSRPERTDPSVLAQNGGLSFVGSIVLGMGFTLKPGERDALIARDRRNAERILPYIGGKEVNTSPTQSFHRYVISFGQMSLEEAEQWPDLIQIVREKVKPERDELRDNANGRRRREYWWQFGCWTPALYAAIRGLERCLVTACVTKHLCFSFQQTDRIFSEKIYVFPFCQYIHFAILQSRVHELWTRLLSSTMRNDISYSASDCFENFPFPQPDPRTVVPELEDIGGRLYKARARYMVDTDQGLTQTYNRLKDMKCEEQRIVELRTLHEEMDRAVLRAYDWGDIEVPPFVMPCTDEEFSDEVIDRLLSLNAEQAATEKA